MATTLETYTQHCQRVEEDYKRLHQQHLTVFGAFQRLQQAATGLRKSTEHINKALATLDSSVAENELSRMLDEQEMIMNKLRLMERENVGLIGGEESDPMYNKHISFPIEDKKHSGGGPPEVFINDETPPTHHPRPSHHPPYNGYHDSHIAPYKKANGGGTRDLNKTYLEFVEHIASTTKPPFESFYGYTNALVDIACPHELFTEAAKHNPTLNYPFRRMLSEIVGNVRWCDYVFHHRIPGMFTIADLELLSKLKADAYNPCLKIVVIDDNGREKNKWEQLFKADYEEHNHRTRVVFSSVSPEVQYFLPAFEAREDGDHCYLTLLFHVARGTHKECKGKILRKDVQSYYVKVPNLESPDHLQDITTLRVLNSEQSEDRKIFRKYAFFHASVVTGNHTAIIQECTREFEHQHNILTNIWKKGYVRLEKAVRKLPSKQIYELLTIKSD